VKGDDVRVKEPARRARLALEPLHEARVLGELGLEHLDRDGALHRGLKPAVDDPHPTAPDALLDAVSPVEIEPDEGVFVRAHTAGPLMRDARIVASQSGFVTWPRSV